MKICITIDDVLRDKTRQFGKIFKKYIDENIDLQSLNLENDDLCEVFKFNSRNEYNEFLYKDYAYEIFAEAPVTEKMIDKNLNLWHLSLTDYDDLDEPIELVLANTKEFNFSIGYTCFFLSKIATKCREIYFPKDGAELWDKCDVIITADKHILETKPEGKKSVKITMPYNEECECDLEYFTLVELMQDNKFIEKLTNNDN